MWEGEVGENPALGAPGSNDYMGLIASTTNQAIGWKASKLQGLSEKEEADLCKEYRPLVLSLAARYSGKGIDFDELKAAGQLGVARALRRFDPNLGYAFGAYAKPWVMGEITSLFKPTKDALSFGHAQSLNAPIGDDEDGNAIEFMDRVADEALPAISHDLSALSGYDRHIIEARLAGETLAEIGKELGISAERVRQREVRARSKIKGITASECLRDLVRRGERKDVIRFPVEHTRRWSASRDREPTKHEYREPKPSREIVHHRANAARLAELRGNEPIRGTRDLGPVIHAWGRS